MAHQGLARLEQQRRTAPLSIYIYIYINIPLFLPTFRLYEVVSLHTCVLPYMYRVILELLPELTEPCKQMGRRHGPLTFQHPQNPSTKARKKIKLLPPCAAILPLLQRKIPYEG